MSGLGCWASAGVAARARNIRIFAEGIAVMVTDSRDSLVSVASDGLDSLRRSPFREAHISGSRYGAPRVGWVGDLVFSLNDWGRIMREGFYE